MTEGAESWTEHKTVGKRMDTTLGLGREQPVDTPQARLLISDPSQPGSSNSAPQASRKCDIGRR
jgi:hypothetical protein